MKVYQDPETGSWLRGAPSPGAAVGTPRRNGSAVYLVTEIDEHESMDMYLVFDRFDHHNTSVTVWLRKVVWEQVIDEDGDTTYQRITTDTQYPMRLSKWERVLRTKLLMKGWFHGKFVVNKQGTAISLELKE